MIIITVFILITLEIILLIFFTNLRKKFPWIISKKDLYPHFDKKKFNNFKKKRFDNLLGWDKKPKTTSYDFLQGKKIKYEIDKRGYRKLTKRKKKELVASFGDSYVFCRQVKDNNTWQESISKNEKYCILNFGVGNYGLDQSVLKYSKTKLKKQTKFIIQGFVPETINRIQSQWKHFIEFGNLHGFKPVFFLKNKKLKLKKNPINKDTKIKELPKIINKLILSDRFYKDKFLNHLIDFPYTYYFLKNFKFNFEILYNYIFFNILNFLRKKNDLIDILFSIVVKKNIKLSHSLYNEYYSTMLLEKIIQKFIIITKKRKHKPIIIIFPQLMDLKNNKTNLLYTNFFILMKNKINVIDLTPHFKNKNLDKLFTNDKYGGHLSVFGNKFVSNIIKKKLNTIINNQS
jgi:hypothetical protein